MEARLMRATPLYELSLHPFQRMPLCREHPSIQRNPIYIRERQPKILQRLGSPKALLHIDPVILSARPIHVRELRVPVWRLAMLLERFESVPGPVAVALLARDAPGVEEGFDVLWASLVLRLKSPEAGGRPLLELLWGARFDGGRAETEFGDPGPGLGADFGGCRGVDVTAAFEESERETA